MDEKTNPEKLGDAQPTEPQVAAESQEPAESYEVPYVKAPPKRPNIFKRANTGIKKRRWLRIISKSIMILVILAVIALIYDLGYHQGQNSNNCHRSNSLQICPGQAECPGGPCIQADEPVVNLYPTHKEKVTVKLAYPAGLSYTSPKYNTITGWQVLATPSGELTNLANGQQYPYLIWEGKPAPIHFDMSTGFVVPASQTASFLHRELPIIGLSPKETNDFITYWQPRLSNSSYNLIHFAGKNYTNYAKLKITPKPDSLLRVFMAYQPLEKPVKVAPQTFKPFHRVGFTAVEWGGGEFQRPDY